MFRRRQNVAIVALRCLYRGAQAIEVPRCEFEYRHTHALGFSVPTFCTVLMQDLQDTRAFGGEIAQCNPLDILAGDGGRALE